MASFTVFARPSWRMTTGRAGPIAVPFSSLRARHLPVRCHRPTPLSCNSKLNKGTDLRSSLGCCGTGGHGRNMAVEHRSAGTASDPTCVAGQRQRRRGPPNAEVGEAIDVAPAVSGRLHPGSATVSNFASSSMFPFGAFSPGKSTGDPHFIEIGIAAKASSCVGPSIRSPDAPVSCRDVGDQ